MKSLRERIEDWLTAVIFAEAGLSASAIAFFGTKQPVQQPLRLELPGVKIWDGAATNNG